MLTVNLETRTIDVELANSTATMRAPSVGEWREIRRRYVEADQKIRAEGDNGSDVRYGDDAPCAAAFAFALATLADMADPDPDKLPLAAAGLDPYVEMAKLWANPPVKTVGGTDPDDAFTPMPED